MHRRGSIASYPGSQWVPAKSLGMRLEEALLCIVVRAKKEGDLGVVSGKIYSDVPSEV